MDDRERYERERNIEWARLQPATQLLFQRTKLVLVLMAIAFVLSVIDWAWPNAVKLALQPLKALVRWWATGS